MKKYCILIVLALALSIFGKCDRIEAEDVPVYPTIPCASGGYYTLVINEDGDVIAWGLNDFVRISDANTIYVSSDQPVTLMKGGAVSVFTNQCVALILDADGVLWGLGYNMWGQLGGSNVERFTVPTKIMDDVRMAVLGTFHVLVLKSDGSVYGWGTEANGTLCITDEGDGRPLPAIAPENAVKILDDISFIDGTGYVNCAISKKGELYVWGETVLENDKEFSGNPLQVLDGIKYASIYSYGLLAIKDDESLWYYHGDESEQVLTNAVYCKSARSFAAIKSDNSLWLWGYNGNGQLGDGTIEELSEPKRLFENATYCVFGNYLTFVLDQNGDLWEIGYDSEYDSINFPNLSDYYTPRKIMSGLVIVK